MELKNGQYTIQDVPLTEIAKTFGHPVYVYDAQKIVEQFQRLKAAFQPIDVKIKYAAKSLSNINILKLLRKAGAGLDCVSIQEVYLGLKAGFSPQEILFTPNCISFTELEEAVEIGVTINIDNISILEQFGNKYHGQVPCCIRINPHILAGGNAKIQVGHIDSKFGISIHQMPHVLRVVKHLGIKVIGLHMHSGSDILNSDVFLQAAEVLFNATQGFEHLEFIDLGSGFKVAYKDGDITTDIEELGQKMTERFKEFQKSFGKPLDLWFEPGKFLVSEAGVFLVKTNVIKHTTSAVFAGVDSGLNHLIRPMMYDAYHEIVNASNPNGPERIYSIVGYICETDTFGWDRKVNEIREGDLLAIKNAGAYGYSMSSNYNSRFRPAEVLVINGQAKLIRKAENMEDILKNQVLLDDEIFQQDHVLSQAE